MDPLATITLFILFLGIILFYLQRRENRRIAPTRVEKDSIEGQITGSKEYQTRYEDEQEKAGPSSSTPDDEEAKEDDISTLSGIGPRYRELLRAAGYTSIKSLNESNPEEVYAKLIEINNTQGITKRPPTLDQVAEWIKSTSIHEE